MTERIKWEYKTILHKGLPFLDHELDQIGILGWELVAITVCNDHFVCFFKRRIQIN
jgi:hypothetical protein